MVTDVPAAILRLDTGAGRIVIGGAADLAVFRDSGRTPAETLLRRSTSAPEMVICRGKVKLLSKSFARRVPGLAHGRFTRLHVEGRGEFLVDADVPRRYKQAVRQLTLPVRLAGRVVNSSTPARDWKGV